MDKSCVSGLKDLDCHDCHRIYSAFTFTYYIHKRFFWALVLPQIYPIICTLHILIDARLTFYYDYPTTHCIATR